MAEYFLGEIRLMSFNFAPKYWAQCNGQLLSIAQNQALFSLLGTTYGGDGQVNFALPDFRGRVPVHTGSGIQLGQNGGEEAHTLTLGEMPAHTHQLMVYDRQADTGATTTPPGPKTFLARATAVTASGDTVPVQRFSADAPTGALAAETIAPEGASQPHENRQPFLALEFCIALQGIFPSQN